MSNLIIHCLYQIGFWGLFISNNITNISFAVCDIIPFVQNYNGIHNII